ncbi:hypothetical protein [Alteromonas ponticola]|uniref:Lipoprotein n=1 Tax=Alteromonas ponticola TaxID=2720613 RepID=A0ABX1R645_9ALTE|nr:hypothetical protein [Alteromonas ponticola]NMH61126.1 hypothetical protein [Alteromonas ponticola]
MQNKRLLFIFGMLFLLLSCKGDNEEGLGKYGMLDESTPEYAAVRFMTSIYNDPNIDVAVSLSTPKMARILSRYHTNRNVQRHLLNLKFDTVTISPEERSRVGRNEFSEKATITLFFSGKLNDSKQEDLRRIDLVREDGQWLVERIHPDHFM